MARNAEAEVAKMKMLEERIKAPSIWGRVPCGIRFEDLQDRSYEDAVRLLKNHFLSEEITYRSVKISNEKEATDEFVHNVRIWMKDKMSIAAVKEGTNKLVGVLIMRIQEKTDRYLKPSQCVLGDLLRTKRGVYSKNFFGGVWGNRPPLLEAGQAKTTCTCKCGERNEVSRIVGGEEAGVNEFPWVAKMTYFKKFYCGGAYSRTFSHVKITHSPQYTQVITFYREIEKGANLFEKLDVKRYLKIYVLALKARYRHRGIAKEMLKAAIGLSESANVPAISGIFTTGRGQQIAEELGFEKFNELYYIRYIINDEIVFWDTGLGNYGAALMAYRIPTVVEPQELQMQPSSRFNIQQPDDDDDDD
ncbi:seminal fluid protein CSSFP038 [Danaus plexippus plexippus]|uniref:Seminal fluid protein CSSFP038 n=1 Tax=Danaus plexippus plexippus TaxID=278856 RepID=A0A212EMT7_DANPL|nr:seminal fluid protein CSSFP038 [Danaus plexippus plexippus]